MRFTTGALTGLGLMMATLMPQQAAAEAIIYPYGGGVNYCPAGYQPVTISGVICCGRPNQVMSYQQALATPAVKKKRHYRPVRKARVSCQPGSKGCASY